LENNIDVYYDKKEYIVMSRKIVKFIWNNDLSSDISFNLDSATENV